MSSINEYLARNSSATQVSNHPDEKITTFAYAQSPWGTVFVKVTDAYGDDVLVAFTPTQAKKLAKKIKRVARWVEGGVQK